MGKKCPQVRSNITKKNNKSGIMDGQRYMEGKIQLKKKPNEKISEGLNGETSDMVWNCI